MSLDAYKYERDAFFDRAFNKAFGRIEDYRFIGWNNALGCFVKSKEHYRRILKDRGLLPFDGAEALAEEYKSKAERNRLPELSEKSRAIIRALREHKRKDGTVKIEGRLLEAMIEAGAINDISPYEPSVY